MAVGYREANGKEAGRHNPAGQHSLFREQELQVSIAAQYPHDIDAILARLIEDDVIAHRKTPDAWAELATCSPEQRRLGEQLEDLTDVVPKDGPPPFRCLGRCTSKSPSSRGVRLL